MCRIELVFNDKEKYLKFGNYIKYFEDATCIDDLLSKITDKSMPVDIYADKFEIDKHKISKNSNPFLYTYIEDLPIFDEHILEHIDNIKLKRFKPKQEWQLQFGKEVYVTNDSNVRQQFIDKNVFCFDKQDLIEFKKNNWQIDNGYMVRVFFDGKNINFEGTSKPENER